MGQGIARIGLRGKKTPKIENSVSKFAPGNSRDAAHETSRGAGIEKLMRMTQIVCRMSTM